jgi:hypothetical protein
MSEEEEVEYVFILPHLERLWPALEKLGYDTRTISSDFQKDYRADGRGYAESNYFLKWGVEKLQPKLNEHLKRPGDHPTFYKIMHTILEDVIDNNDYIRKKRGGNRPDLQGF